MRIVCIIDSEQRREAQECTTRIRRKKVRAGARSYRKSSRSEEDILYYGILAEMAVGEQLGVSHNWGEYYAKGDGGVDLIYKGWKVQVKFTFHATGDLYFNRHAPFNADIAVLVKGTDKMMMICGIISRPLYEQRRHAEDYGHGPVLAVTEAELEPWEKLEKWVNEEPMTREEGQGQLEQIRRMYGG